MDWLLSLTVLISFIIEKNWGRDILYNMNNNQTF